MKHTTSDAGGDEAGPAGRAEAAARLAHHERTARGGDRGGPSVEPLSTTIAR